MLGQMKALVELTEWDEGKLLIVIARTDESTGGTHGLRSSTRRRRRRRSERDGSSGGDNQSCSVRRSKDEDVGESREL